MPVGGSHPSRKTHAGIGLAFQYLVIFDQVGQLRTSEGGRVRIWFPFPRFDRKSQSNAS